MTEQEWLRSPEPVRMVTHLRFNSGLTRTKGGRRKLRLFGCACCRRVPHIFPGEPWWPAVGLAEQLADGTTDQADVDAALRAAGLVLRDGEGDRLRQARGNLHQAVLKVCGPIRTAPMACSSVGIALRWLGSGEAAESAVQADLLRDVFGNPFRRPPLIEPGVLQWNGGTIQRLADEAYEHRRLPSGHLDPPMLAVLADALEEAGADAALVAHLREPGPHYRGCHALDQLLDKS
jgi:hypothetical protein